ncbi:MAG: ABC transporter ATP-binding protein/permease [Christensenellaceae bacterium]|jgi:ABC-type multidrug transport system fused ATPase/permease subunit|nr:ABC transporter ATP-binding protein/permease [Christensenellaceae bacterium]
MISAKGKSRIFRYLGFNKKRLAFLFVLNGLQAVMTSGLALVYGALVNSVAEGAKVDALIHDSVLALVYSLVTAGLGIFIHIFSNFYFHNMRYSMMRDVFAKIVNSSYEDISSEDSSHYYDTLTNDVNQSTSSMWNVVNVFKQVIMVVSSFVAAVILNWWIALVMVGFTVLLGVMPLFIKKPLDKANDELSKSNKAFALVAKENLQGVSIIKSFSAERHTNEFIFERTNSLLSGHKKTTRIDAAAAGAASIVSSFSIISLVALTCYAVIIGEVKIGAVLSIVQIGMAFYGNVQQVANYMVWILGCKSYRDKVWRILGSNAEEEEADSDFAFKDTVTLNNVSFSYQDADRKVLDGFTYSFEKGKKYLVLGRSGSGKSTLLKLLARFYSGYEGDIVMDGANYADIKEKNITKVVAIAQQNCFIFKRPLSENIDFLATGDKERLAEAVRLSALTDFVGLLPDGLNSVVDEEVTQVSGGEKLRINLARAYYKGGDILLLDEVTSALDKTTSAIVENNLLSLKDKTLINVCHKFNDSTLEKYDGILVIESGKLVAAGSFDDLKADPVLLSYRDIEE